MTLNSLFIHTGCSYDSSPTPAPPLGRASSTLVCCSSARVCSQSSSRNTFTCASSQACVCAPPSSARCTGRYEEWMESHTHTRTRTHSSDLASPSSPGSGDWQRCQAHLHSGGDRKPDVGGRAALHGPGHLHQHDLVCPPAGGAGCLLPVAGTIAWQTV